MLAENLVADKAFNICCLIPVYNNEETITSVVKSLREYDLPCIIVNDGSSDNTSQLVSALAKSDSQLHLLNLSSNSGKGAAVIAGFSKAIELGFTHALQLDADGQHDVKDVPKFIELATQNLEHLIAGKPLFDKQAPLARLWGRKLSVWLSWLETLSRDIGDVLYGMRIYPLAACKSLLAKRNIGSRMDFDTDIAIKLY